MNECRKTKVLFWATPEFAIPSLKAIKDTKDIDIVAVITQTDKPCGRGQKFNFTPIKKAALDLNLTVLQPETLKNIKLNTNNKQKILEGENSLVQFLNSRIPIDISICIAYGKIIPQPILDFTNFGMINLHPSLLPLYRGAAPIQRCIFNGDKKTGVSIMQVTQGLDSGPVFSQEEIEISNDDYFGSMHDKLSLLGAKVLVKTLKDVMSHKAIAVEQCDTKSCYAEKWELKDAEINWNDTADRTIKRIKASNPIPGARTKTEDGSLVKIFSATKVLSQNYCKSFAVGSIVEINKEELIVAVGSKEYISIKELQFAGKKRLNIKEFLSGCKLKIGDKFF